MISGSSFTSDLISGSRLALNSAEPRVPFCTLCTWFSACREGTRCTQDSHIFVCREDRACTPRSCLSACREGRGCTSRTCFSPCRGGRWCTSSSCLSALHGDMGVHFTQLCFCSHAGIACVFYPSFLSDLPRAPSCAIIPVKSGDVPSKSRGFSSSLPIFCSSSRQFLGRRENLPPLPQSAAPQLALTLPCSTSRLAWRCTPPPRTSSSPGY